MIDWGAVTRGPLLWDLYPWARTAGAGADRVVTAHVESGGPVAMEVSHLAVMGRLAAAHELRFRTFRVANGEHHDESVNEDRAGVVRAATELGVDPAAILKAIG